MSFQNLWRAARKCQTSKTSVQSLRQTASETAEQQQDSCPNHATATTNNAETLPTKRVRSWMSFQNLWRAAMKCQTSKTMRNSDHEQCRNVAYENELPNRCLRNCLRNALSVKWASKTFGGPPGNVKHQKLASKAFGGPLPKQPNSSRIRVQTMRNSDHEQCRNVAYETH